MSSLEHQLIHLEVDTEAGNVVRERSYRFANPISIPDFLDFLRWLPKVKAIVELLEEFRKRLMDILGKDGEEAVETREEKR